MKSRQVALIRGINVGRAKRVAMADLRAMMERLGYRDCRTLLNSGNLVFTSESDSPQASALRIEQAMEAELGVAAPVMALDARDFSTIISECPLVEVAEDPSRLLVSFLLNPAQQDQLAPLTKRVWKPEAMALGSFAAYLWCPDGVLKSQLLVAVDRALGQALTTRNWKTVLKIQAVL